MSVRPAIESQCEETEAAVLFCECFSVTEHVYHTKKKKLLGEDSLPYEHVTKPPIVCNQSASFIVFCSWNRRKCPKAR